MNTGYARFHSDETYLQLASLSFDASTFELWAPLLHGARVSYIPPGVPSPERLAEVIREHKISTLWLTASLFNLIINDAPDALKRSLAAADWRRTTIDASCAAAQENLDGTLIINGYGPTESTTFTCCYSIPKGIAPNTILPIGDRLPTPAFTSWTPLDPDCLSASPENCLSAEMAWRAAI